MAPRFRADINLDFSLQEAIRRGGPRIGEGVRD